MSCVPEITPDQARALLREELYRIRAKRHDVKPPSQWGQQQAPAVQDALAQDYWRVKHGELRIANGSYGCCEVIGCDRAISADRYRMLPGISTCTVHADGAFETFARSTDAAASHDELLEKSQELADLLELSAPIPTGHYFNDPDRAGRAAKVRQRAKRFIAGEHIEAWVKDVPERTAYLKAFLRYLLDK